MERLLLTLSITLTTLFSCTTDNSSSHKRGRIKAPPKTIQKENVLKTGYARGGALVGTCLVVVVVDVVVVVVAVVVCGGCGLSVSGGGRQRHSLV